MPKDTSKLTLTKRDSSKSILLKVEVCFFLSGMASLLYQTAWMRQLSVVFGTSELAVAAVLTAYMAGLALGAALSAKYVFRVSRPLLTYGLLEAGIAISAVLVPTLLLGAGALATQVLGGHASPPQASGFAQMLFYFLSTLVILVIPTALMGATLPLLSKYVVKTNEQIGIRIGGLYAINTFGAVAGTLVAAFVLLPFISLTSTISIGALLNFTVLAIVISIIKTDPTSTPQSTQSSPSKTEKPCSLNFQQTAPRHKAFWKAPYGWILPIMALSGVATFTYEILWTRLIGHVLGGSVAAFAIMLAGFLIGIAVGSAIAAKRAMSQVSARHWFILSQLGIASLSAFIYFMINASVPDNSGLLSNSVLTLSLLLPATFFIGATFPLAVRMLANNENDAPGATARVYAWNTVGAIFGATLAGYFLVPAIKYAGAIQFAVYLNLTLACAATFLGSSSLKTPPSNKIQNTRIALPLRLSPFVLAILVGLLYRPQWPENVVNFSPINAVKPSAKDIVYYGVGRTATVLLFDNKTHFSLRTNGLTEANIVAKGVNNRGLNSQSLLSVLPVIARPEAKTMLVAGFGGGVAVERVPPSIKEVDVVELETKVIEANRLISNRRQYDPFTDSRLRIIYNDARNALMLSDKRYDIIVSQPSHPWTAGASHLYTQEFMQLAKSRLTENSVFLQWMNTDFTSEYLLKSLTATLADTFKYVRVYQFHPRVLSFLASDQELEPERLILQTGGPMADDQNYYKDIGIATAEALLAGLAFDDQGARNFARDGQIITDDLNILATRSALAMDANTVLSYQRLQEIILEDSPLYNSESWIYTDLNNGLDFKLLLNRVYYLNTPAFDQRILKLSSVNRRLALHGNN
ncbi:MAG: spermidine synthase [Dinoroseobacter sp.]|jgi:spermidine synthase